MESWRELVRGGVGEGGQRWWAASGALPRALSAVASCRPCPASPPCCERPRPLPRQSGRACPRPRLRSRRQQRQYDPFPGMPSGSMPSSMACQAPCAPCLAPWLHGWLHGRFPRGGHVRGLHAHALSRRPAGRLTGAAHNLGEGGGGPAPVAALAHAEQPPPATAHAPAVSVAVGIAFVAAHAIVRFRSTFVVITDTLVTGPRRRGQAAGQERTGLREGAAGGHVRPLSVPACGP